MPKQATEERWFPLIEKLEQSGLPTRKFANAHGVNANTLAWWRAYFRRTIGVREAFVEVELKLPLEPEPQTLIIRFHERPFIVEVGSDIAAAQLAALVDALC